VLVAAGAAPGGCEPAPTTPTLSVTTVASGLSKPWDLQFLPGGTTLVLTEHTGEIDALVDGTVRELAAPADAVQSGEGGMMGIAVDPAFATNRRIYTCFLSNAGGSLDVRVVRWQVDAGITTLTNRSDIVTGLPVNTAGSAGRHSGCRPRFGPDGMLWIGTGDAATPTNPQSRTSLGGKVLRVTTTGAAAPGNPGGAFDPRIYTYGHRNVQGLAFDNAGRAYSVEHGTGRDDEVNRLVAGANYGWDPVDPANPARYDESRPMTDLAKFPTARRAVWTSGNPTIAPSGATFLTGAEWGTWNGALVMAVLKGQQLRVLILGAGGTSVASQATAVTNQGRLRTAVQGPAGDLYVTTDATPGRILRVAPV
jgi:glucose/arabinose dehydrogenase